MIELDFYNIENYVPPQNLYAMMVVGHVLEILRDLRIIGELGVERDNEGRVRSIQSRWVSLMFNWDDVCMPNGLCQGETDFDQLSGYSHLVEHPLEVTERTRARMKFSAQIDDFTYGNIALGVLEASLIPIALGDAQQREIPLEYVLRDTLGFICNIRSLTGYFSSPDTCLDTLGTKLSRLINRELNLLNVSGALHIRGALTPIDLDQDLMVDDFHLGRWYIESEQADFNGCFATCINDRCEQTTCQFNVD